MSVDFFIVGEAQPTTRLSNSDSLKSGPTPREVEVLERWHRDRVHSERGKPGQAHSVERAKKPSLTESSDGSVALSRTV